MRRTRGRKLIHNTKVSSYQSHFKEKTVSTFFLYENCV
jgi:hypothetical protein